MTLEGVLMSPLAVGHRALVYTRGRPMLTSTVVAIHGICDDEIRFETRNTNYTLRGNPSPQSDCEPLPAAFTA